MGSAELLWHHGRGIRLQFAWKGESKGVSRGSAGSLHSLELPREPEGASHLVSGKSRILSSCGGPLGIPLELVQVTRASSWLEAGNSGFLHKDGVICISEVTDIFPSNLDSSLCFFQPTNDE